MQSLKDCLLLYRLTLRHLLYEADIPSNPGVSDDWILNQISMLVRSGIAAQVQQAVEQIVQIARSHKASPKKIVKSTEVDQILSALPKGQREHAIELAEQKWNKS